ncbi:MAG: LamG domain-containing protein [Clostridia bacterium]|nr:LamG domain-containing protein [Clostridia bacterium]
MMKTLRGILVFVICLSMALPVFALPDGAQVKNTNLTKAQIQQTIVDVLVKNLPYAYSQFVPINTTLGYFRNLESSGVSGNSAERGVRPNADYALVFAFLCKYASDAELPMVPVSANDSTKVQLTREMLKATFLQSLRYGYRTHRANAVYMCTDSQYWGSFSGTTVWESSMWAESLAVAAYLMWDEISSADRAGIQKMVVGEADQQLTRSVPTQYISDTKAEENGWDTNILACAVAMFPDHANASAWDEKCKSFAYNSYSTSADAYDESIVDGKLGKDWYIGATLFDDYTLENHNFFHTSYLTVINQELSESYLMYEMALPDDKKEQFPLPQALRHNVAEVWDNVLGRLATSDSELAMPNGNDWSMYLLDQFESYAALATIYNRKEAHMLASRCIQMIAARQMTTADGAFMLNPDVGNRRMGVSARRMVFGYLLYEHFAAEDIDDDTMSWDEYSAQTTSARNYAYAKIMRASSADRFATFSWYESSDGSYRSYMGNLTPDTDDDLNASFMVYPYKTANRGNFTGSFAVSGKSQNASLSDHSDRIYTDGFATIGSLLTEDSSLTQYSAFYVPEGGNAVVYLDKVVANEAVTVTSEKGLPLAVTVDPFTSNTRTIITQDGETTTNGLLTQTYGGNWMNVDNKLGIVVDGSSGLATGERVLSNSVYVMQLYGSYSAQQRTFNSGAEIADRVQVVYSNVDAATTQSLAAEVKELSGKDAWKAVMLKDPDGKEYIFTAHFYTDRPIDATLDVILTSTEGSPVLADSTVIEADRSIAYFYDAPLTANGQEIKAYIQTDGRLSAWVSKNGVLYVNNPTAEASEATLKLRCGDELRETHVTIDGGASISYDGENVDEEADEERARDIAYAKDVEVSSHMPYGTKNLINDNDVSTEWIAKEASDARVVFDLGVNSRVSGVNLKNAVADSINVYVSNTQSPAANNLKCSGAPGELMFNEQAYGRYVTVDFESSLQRPSAAEIEVYGESVASVNVEFYLIDETGDDVAEPMSVSLPTGMTVDARDYAPIYVIHNGKKYTMSQTLNEAADMIFTVRSGAEVEVYYENSGVDDDGVLIDLSFDDYTTGFKGALGKSEINGDVVVSEDSIYGGAAYFDGTSNSYLDLYDYAGGSLLTGYDSITVSFFNKKDGAASAADGGWVFFAAPSAAAQSYPYEHYLALYDQGTTMTVERYNNQGTRPTNPTAASSLAWKHVALVIEPSTTYIYVDGVLKTTLASAHALTDILGSSSVAYIGRANWGSGEWYKGYLDDFRIYNHALTAQQILQMGTKINVPVNYITENQEELMTEYISQYGGAGGCSIVPEERKVINGALYEYVPEGSVTKTKMSADASLTLVYRAISSSDVTVHYADNYGVQLKADTAAKVAFGESFSTGVVDGFESVVITDGYVYEYSHTTGSDIIADGEAYDVTIVYNLLGTSVPENTLTALRGATIRRATGQNHENTAEYQNRIMADSRTTSTSGALFGLMGFDCNEGTVATKATVTLYTGADSNQTTATKFALYPMENLDSSWTRATVAGITSIPDCDPIARVDIGDELGAGVMNAVEFDVTEYFNSVEGRTSLNFMVVSESSEAYGVFYSENTAYAPTLKIEGYTPIEQNQIAITSITEDAITVEASFMTRDVRLVAAQYDEDGALVKITSAFAKTPRSLEVVSELDTECSSLRIFAWDGMEPICEVKTIE